VKYLLVDPSPISSVSRVMFDVPSNETPEIVLAFCKAVAVAALPVIELDVRAIDPVVLGNVNTMFPENAA